MRLCKRSNIQSSEEKQSLYDKYIRADLNGVLKDIYSTKSYNDYFGVNKFIADMEIEDNKPKQNTKTGSGGFNAPKKPNDDQKIEVKKPEKAGSFAPSLQAGSESEYGLCEIPNDLKKKAQEIERFEREIGKSCNMHRS